MYVHINASALKETLPRLKAGLSGSDYHSSHPYVVLQTRQGQLVLSTWKERMRIDASVPCEVEQEGSFAVAYQALLQATRSLDGTLLLKREDPDLLVSSSAGAQGDQLPIAGEEAARASRCRLETEVLEGTTYSRTDTETITCEACRSRHTEKIELTYTVERVIRQQIRMHRARLARLLRKVNWMPVEVHGRLELRGLCLEVAAGQLSVTGTDSSSLAIVDAAVAEGSAPNWELRVLVESALLTRTLQALPQAEVCLEAVFTRQRLVARNGQAVADAEPFERPALLRLSSGPVTASIPLMHLPIPDYRAILPPAWITRASCSRAQLHHALQALASVGTVVSYHLSPARIAFEVEHRPQPARHQVPVTEMRGPEARLRCDTSSLLRALEHIPADQVALEVRGEGRPIMLLRPIESGEGNYVFVVQCEKRSC